MGFKPISTARLTLRPYEERDRARLVKLANNWRVAKNLGTMPYPYTQDRADEWLAKQKDMWASGQHVPLIIALEDELIGAVGLHVRDHGAWEIGYWLGEPYWNRGYATEAGKAVVAYAFEALDIDRLAAGHFADNHASGSVLTKLGFRYTVEAMRPCLARGVDVKCLEMTLPRAVWAQAANRQQKPSVPAQACAS